MIRPINVFAAIFFVLAPLASHSCDYVIDHTQSEIRFSGQHAGETFSGIFTNWHGDIHFDSEDLDHSYIDVTIDTESATTGNSMYDGTLPSMDWFATEAHPKANYKTARITQGAPGTYLATGTLTLRGISHPANFKFTLPEGQYKHVHTTAALEVDRLAYDIGKKSDPTAEWVSQVIGLQLTLAAHCSEAK